MNAENLDIAQSPTDLSTHPSIQEIYACACAHTCTHILYTHAYTPELSKSEPSTNAIVSSREPSHQTLAARTVPRQEPIKYTAETMNTYTNANLQHRILIQMLCCNTEPRHKYSPPTLNPYTTTSSKIEPKFDRTTAMNPYTTSILHHWILMQMLSCNTELLQKFKSAAFNLYTYAILRHWTPAQNDPPCTNLTLQHWIPTGMQSNNNESWYNS
jgi:hypothetical protein